MRAAVVGLTITCIASIAVLVTLPAEAMDRDRPGRDTVEPDPLVELGRRLFFDPAAARFGNVACSGCHDPEHGFSDARQQSLDDDGRTTPRHSQTLLDLADTAAAGFHWDGEFPEVRDVLVARVASAELAAVIRTERAVAHLDTAAEAGENVDMQELLRSGVLTGDGGYRGGPITPSGDNVPPVTAVRTIPERLRDGGLYDDAFVAAFRDAEITEERVIDAMEAYLLSIRSTEGSFDRYLGGEETAISDAAERGFVLFAGEAGCATCHTIPGSGDRRALADGTFHNTGVAASALVDIQGATKVTQLPDEAMLTGDGPDAGRGGIDFRDAHDHQFKTANLRDVAVRAPYMHDGSLATLRDVVDYYAAGGKDDGSLDPHIKKLDLGERERDDLVAFLESLTGDVRPALGAASRARADEMMVRITDIEGVRLSSTDITVVPSGDRLAGTDAMPAAFIVRTTGSGIAKIPLPASTHVTLSASGWEIAEGRMIPDTARTLHARATRTDRISVVVSPATDGGRLPAELLATAMKIEPPGLPERRRTRSNSPQMVPIEGGPYRLAMDHKLADGRAIYTGETANVTETSLFRIRGSRGSDAGVFRIMDFSGGASEAISLATPEADRDLRRRMRDAQRAAFRHLPKARRRR